MKYLTLSFAFLLTLATLAVSAVASEALAETCKRLSPSTNLAVLADRSDGTCYVLTDGTYRINRPIILSGGDTWRAADDGDNQRPRILNGGGAENIFDGKHKSSNVTIEGLRIEGAKSEAHCQEEAPFCGRGISAAGANFRAHNLLIVDHDNSGIGSPGSGSLITDTVIDDVGSKKFSIYSRPSDSACIKTNADSLTVIRLRCTDFYWNGVWLDGGGKMVVRDSVFARGGHVAVQNELASTPGSVIAGNTIVRNGQTPDPNENNRSAGIKLLNAVGTDVYQNTIKRNRGEAMKCSDAVDRFPRSKDNILHHNRVDGPIVGKGEAGCTFYKNKRR